MAIIYASMQPWIQAAPDIVLMSLCQVVHRAGFSFHLSFSQVNKNLSLTVNAERALIRQ